MLAMADRRGRVWSTIPGLANRARVSLEAAKSALETFMSPDPYSRTPAFEGRRIEIIDGGWRLLNHEKYRDIRDQEAIKESKRKYINNRRKKEREAMTVGSTVEKVERGRYNAEADTDTEKKKHQPSVPVFSLPDWINKDHWEAWHSSPKRQKATLQQKKLAVAKLEKWKSEGKDYGKALESAAIGGWQGLFEPDAVKIRVLSESNPMRGAI